VVFIESRAFTREIHRLVPGHADEVLSSIQSELQDNSERGDVVPGLGGIRKARTASPLTGKGKRGGLRYMFLYLAHRSHVHLLAVYGKGERLDLRQEEKKVLAALAHQIKQGQRP
jgi:hypothetical protein